MWSAPSRACRLTVALLIGAAVALFVWALTGIYLFILVLPLGAWLWSRGSG